MRLAAPIARQIHDALSATFDLLRGSGVVAPELAKLEQQRECLRYERQERMIVSLHDAEGYGQILTTRRPATSSGCLPAGTFTGCSCVSVDGLPRSTKTGLRIPLYVHCWVPKENREISFLNSSKSPNSPPQDRRSMGYCFRCRRLARMGLATRSLSMLRNMPLPH
jgi:hypothetical protein